MNATPTLLSGTQIASRLAGVDKAAAISIAAAAPQTDPSPIAAVAVATGAADIQQAFGVIPPPPVPATSRMLHFMFAR